MKLKEVKHCIGGCGRVIPSTVAVKRDICVMCAVKALSCDCEYELTETYEDETCVLDMVVVDKVNVFTCKHCGQTKHEYA